MSIYLSKRRSQNGQKKGAFACIFKTKRQKHRPGLANSRFVCFFWLLSFFLSESCCAPPHKSIRSINLMKYKIYLLGNASEMQLNWNDSLNDVSTIRTSFDFYINVRSMYHNDFGSHQCQGKKCLFSFQTVSNICRHGFVSKWFIWLSANNTRHLIDSAAYNEMNKSNNSSARIGCFSLSVPEELHVILSISDHFIESQTVIIMIYLTISPFPFSSTRKTKPIDAFTFITIDKYTIVLKWISIKKEIVHDIATSRNQNEPEVKKNIHKI